MLPLQLFPSPTIDSPLSKYTQNNRTKHSKLPVYMYCQCPIMSKCHWRSLNTKLLTRVTGDVLSTAEVLAQRSVHRRPQKTMQSLIDVHDGSSAPDHPSRLCQDGLRQPSLRFDTSREQISKSLPVISSDVSKPFDHRSRRSGWPATHPSAHELR